MNKKKILLIILLLMVFSLTIGPATAKTENIKIGDNSKYSESSKAMTVKTSTQNFIITHTLKFQKKDFDLDSPFTGYVTVKSKNSKIKIKSLDVQIWTIWMGECKSNNSFTHNGCVLDICKCSIFCDDAGRKCASFTFIPIWLESYLPSRIYRKKTH